MNKECEEQNLSIVIILSNVFLNIYTWVANHTSKVSRSYMTVNYKFFPTKQLDQY